MNTKATNHRRGARWAGFVTGFVGVAALATATATAAVYVTLPMVCNNGPSGQTFNVGVTLPDSVEQGAIYTIRLDAKSSGKISHFGLNYLHDMTVEYVLPTGTSYVEGSARLVAGTGTPNVREAPRLWHRAGVLTMALPGKVENDTAYTPPSIVVQVRAVGAPGSSAVLTFNHFQLKANAFLVGDVFVSCDPRPQPYPIGTTAITAPADPVPVR
jgi:hypothetical protein